MEKVTCKIKIEDLDGVGKGEFLSKASETSECRETALPLALLFVLRTLDTELSFGKKGVLLALAKVVVDLTQDDSDDAFDEKTDAFIQSACEVCLDKMKLA